MGSLRRLKQRPHWASWGVQPHWRIPESLLDKFAALPDFDIGYVRSAAKRSFAGYVKMVHCRIEDAGLDPSEVDLVSAYRDRAQQLRSLAATDVAELLGDEEVCIFASGFLEYHMVADMLEEMAEKIE